MRAALAGEQVRVRNPNSIRPWQHVLNPLSGYLVLAQALWDSPEHASRLELRPAGGGRAPGRLARRAARRAVAGRRALDARRRPAPARGALPEARLLAGPRAPGLAPAAWASRTRCESIVDWYRALRDGSRHARGDARTDRRASLRCCRRHEPDHLPILRRPAGSGLRRPRHVAAGELLPAARARQRDGAVLPAARAGLRQLLPRAAGGVRDARGRSSPTTPTSPRTHRAGSSTAAATPSR